ncbi:GDSL esterase/lipase [Apostasia shenzhenica]|uniref:carnosine N-methyltransferase n=1 Tax=Apostasia shenzhenica TaxID=1088818 RepID=A0A2I0B9B6_9ASPA|nr:GDSL esterase/lipase [Apostasia shenzhenica]
METLSSSPMPNLDPISKPSPNRPVSLLVPPFFFLDNFTADCNTNNFFGTLTCTDRPPYRRHLDTHHSIGCFSNGYIIIDYLAIYLELAWMLPFLGLSGRKRHCHFSGLEGSTAISTFPPALLPPNPNLSLSASAGITEGFSMCAGDFVEVYNDVDQEASWDAVVTCFFLDTAHNIVEYIEVIFKVLKDGGVWINLGPLLYHFADSHGPEDELSVEISLEDVKKVAFQYGFELEIERTVQTTYTANPRSMMQKDYVWKSKRCPKKVVAPVCNATVEAKHNGKGEYNRGRDQRVTSRQKIRAPNRQTHAAAGARQAREHWRSLAERARAESYRDVEAKVDKRKTPSRKRAKMALYDDGCRVGFIDLSLERALNSIELKEIAFIVVDAGLSDLEVITVVL